MAAEPEVVEAEELPAVRVKSGFVPVPVSGTESADPMTLVVTESEAVSAVAEEGVKTMLTVQFAPAASVEPQVDDD